MAGRDGSAARSDALSELRRPESQLFSQANREEVGVSVLEARGVSRTYRTGTAGECRALVDVDLSVSPGEWVAIVGPSGSGKSTLLAILSGLDRPTGGQLHYGGTDLSACSDVELGRFRRQLGIVFQDFSLIESLSVWENVTYPLIPRGVGRSVRYERARELLDRFSLAGVLDKRVVELSGGEQQRVAVARALVASPAILIADEPTSNLDRASAESLIGFFRELHQDQEMTLVVATHDRRLLAIAQSVYEMDRGELRPRAESGV